MEVVEKVLTEIGAQDIPKLYIFNKIDKISGENFQNNQNSLYISAKKNIGLDILKNKIEEILWQE